MPIYRFDGNKFAGENDDLIDTFDINAIRRIVKKGQTIELNLDQVAVLRNRLYMTLSSDPVVNSPIVKNNTGISYVEAIENLPVSPLGHPVYLVLEDSDLGSASLRYWSGLEWIIVGGASSPSSPETDFIDININSSGIITGNILLWNNTQFLPGAFV